MLDSSKFSTAQFEDGLKVLIHIKKQPARFVRMFEQSFINKKFAYALHIISTGKKCDQKFEDRTWWDWEMNRFTELIDV